MALKLEIQDLDYSYRGGIDVLHGIDLELDGSGLTCIVGPNGVGKSTLIKCMNGLLKPTSGSIRIDGRDVSTFRRKELAMTVGYVPPKTTDLFSIPVMDAIMVGRHNLQGWKNTDADINRVVEILRLMDIEDLAMRPFNQLSSGQHQKVSIARGLAMETPILFLDEPTSNLDIKHQVYVTEMLRGLSHVMDKMIVMISHDLNIAAKYSDNMVVMREPGVIHSFGPPSEVMTEDMIRDVYGIDCTVEYHDGVPHVVLGFVL